MVIYLDSVDDATLRTAVVSVFGPDTHIHRREFLGLGMSHVVYRILLDRPPVECVLRFSRGLSDTFDAEIANYAAVYRLTGVRGPQIYAVDRSCNQAATPFMVMEYLSGTEWAALCRENKAQAGLIRGQVGEFYAHLHSEGVPRPAGDKPNLILGIEQLAEDSADYLDLDRRVVENCAAVARELVAHIDRYVLCFSDGELYFRSDGTYRPAFVLDLQWMRHDLAVVDICSDATVPSDPFYESYARVRGIELDTDYLRRVALCRKLSTWGFIATEAASRTRIPWIKSKRPAITALMKSIPN